MAVRGSGYLDEDTSVKAAKMLGGITAIDWIHQLPQLLTDVRKESTAHYDSYVANKAIQLSPKLYRFFWDNSKELGDFLISLTKAAVGVAEELLKLGKGKAKICSHFLSCARSIYHTIVYLLLLQTSRMLLAGELHC